MQGTGDYPVYRCSKVKKTCDYWRGTQHNGTKTCNYLLMEKQRRGCPAEACDKYKRREGVRGRKPKCTGS